jgi:copper(I)-binding protein
MFRPLIGAAAVFLMAGLATAEEYSLGDLKILTPRSFETADTARAAGGFMLIENAGDTDDRLIRVEADFARVELHTHQMTDGVARMMEIGVIDVPAGGTAVLEPGGLHVMFMGLGGEGFDAGDRFTATLVFENAGRVDVMFDVVAR